MSGWQGPPVLVGERTLWLGSGSGLPKSGIVRWIGRIPEIGPDWTVGLELDEALPVGGIDGTWGGRVLFACRSRHGLLVPISSIIPGSQLKLIPNISGYEKRQNAADSCPAIPCRQPKPKKSLPLPEVLPVVAEPKEAPKPAARQKRRIPTPPSTESDESSENVPHETVTDQATLRVEERADQEDSLKKRLRLFTESHGQARKMESTCNDDVIESLYARRQQYAKHGRSQSDSAHAFISSASSSGSRRERSAIFSIFRWFRKDSRSEEFDEFAPSAPPSPELIRSYSSRCGSVDTLFSTATANSFAFVSPALYRPFGAATPPEKQILSGPETDTYRNRLRQRDKIREQDKNLTLKKKYHLFGSDTLHRSADDVRSGRHFFINKSLDSFKAIDVSLGSKNSTLNRKKRKAPPPPLGEEKPKEISLPNTFEHNKENTETPDNLVKPRHRRTVSDSAKDRRSGAFVHVKGKRRAPPPPVIGTTNNQQTEIHEISGTQSLGRKKRPAPLPPLEINNQEDGEDSSGSPGFLSPGEKQRLIDNIAKLKAHADRKSLLLTTPPASPTLDDKMPHTVCNDSLKLERGVLKANKAEVQSPESKPSTPTPVSPRPWYKRTNSNKEKSLEKRKDKKKIDDWMPEVAMVRGNLINPEANNISVTNVVSASNGNGNINSSSNNSTSHRFSNIFSRFDKPEEKRKSQISMLANISELDREAAEIVQRGQEKEKAVLAAHDAKFYNTVELPTQSPIKQPEVEIIPLHEPATGSPETSKKSGARELISLFNAIGNVTKVTINSAFVSKDGPSIFTKEGIEKRFSMTDGSVKTSEEKVIKESVSQANGYKRETVIIETKETYLESPGIKRRRGLYHQDSGSSTSSDTATPKVVIEEIEEFDGDKSKTQALYEANKIRKHLTPDPSIPTIAEMSESMSSVTTSPGSTLNPSERSVSVTPTPPAIKEESASVSTTVSTSITTASSVLAQSTKNYSIWTCPRCTLENPRWRVTCEACDMWRPAVRKDVIDKLTNTNMGTTIAVNIVKSSKPKTIAAVKNTTSLVETKITPSMTKAIDVPNNKAQEPTKKLFSSGASALLGNSKIQRPITKPITVSSLLSGEGFNGESKIVEKKELESHKSNLVSTAGSASKNSSVVASTSSAVTPLTSTSKPLGAIQKEIKTKDKLSSNNIPTLESVQSNVTTDNDKDMEEIRKARIAFFLKSQSNDKKESSEKPKEETDRETSKNRSSINQAKIDALFSIASKGSLATNEEERLKVKEILKEMKNSLPKRTKEKINAGSSQSDNKVNITKESLQTAGSSSTGTSNDEARLGAIKKTTGQTPISAPSSAAKNIGDVRQKDEKKAEVYLIKSETIIEEIKVKDKSKSPKVSTSVQTNGVVRKIEPNLPVTKDAAKSVNGKPPTPKAIKKEIIVPVTVEEHVTDGSVQTTFTKEQRKMGIRAFELIRPRDFINIEATKTGNEVKPLHTYANIVTTQNDDSSGSSSSSESPEISRLTAQLSKPKGLADFKAAVLEGAAGNKMDTLAVNRLLRQLEGAIAGGQHQRAATLAKQLAKHKVNCCVTRHKQTDTIQVNMFVEDKLSHQGPFPVQVSPTMTVAQLKAKVEREFEIPATVQRWILGKTLAADDSITLAQMGVNKSHSPMFLYLVAPDLSQDKTAPMAESTKNEAPKINVSPATVTVEEATNGAAALAPPPGRGWYYNQQDDRYSYCESETTDHSSKDSSPERRAEPQTAQATVTANVVVEEVETEEEEEEVVEDVEEMVVDTVAAAAVDRIETPPTVLTGTLAIGWKCTVCTLVNAPTRPGCLACAADRPAGYEATATTEQTAQTEVDVKLKNYQDLMTLESADLIPSTESFECSVCLTDCAAGDGIVLRDCLHTFCRACLAHTVQFTDEAEVKCPFRDHNYACDSTLQEREIKAVATDQEEDDSCIVCMADPRVCALTPCGHRAYCETCCLRLIEMDQHCSLCRRKADGYLIIYL